MAGQVGVTFPDLPGCITVGDGEAAGVSYSSLLQPALAEALEMVPPKS